jgi:hypothetical protein
MFYVFDNKGDDQGQYKTLRGAVAKARRRSNDMAGTRHAVRDEDGVLLFEIRDSVEMGAKALEEKAAREFAHHLAGTRT